MSIMTEQKLPTGVRSHYNKFVACYWHDGQRYYCGLHDTAEIAESAIKEDMRMKGFKQNPVGRPSKKQQFK